MEFNGYGWPTIILNGLVGPFDWQSLRQLVFRERLFANGYFSAFVFLFVSSSVVNPVNAHARRETVMYTPCSQYELELVVILF